jgi:hypothetical protein
MRIHGMILASVAVVSATAAMAHHSGAMFDHESVIETEATVVGFEWTNPHAWIQVSYEDPAGAGMKEVDLELGSPVQLVRQGWRPRIVAEGDVVQVGFHPHKDSLPTGLLVTITLPNGTTLTSD